jgi:hypothetical protein
MLATFKILLQGVKQRIPMSMHPVPMSFVSTNFAHTCVNVIPAEMHLQRN